jgi:hypothetical protein
MKFQEQIVQRDAVGRMTGTIVRDMTPLEQYAFSAWQRIKEQLATLDGDRPEAHVVMAADEFDRDLLEKEILRRAVANPPGAEARGWKVKSFRLYVGRRCPCSEPSAA